MVNALDWPNIYFGSAAGLSKTDRCVGIVRYLIALIDSRREGSGEWDEDSRVWALPLKVFAPLCEKTGCLAQRLRIKVALGTCSLCDSWQLKLWELAAIGNVNVTQKTGLSVRCSKKRNKLVYDGKDAASVL